MKRYTLERSLVAEDARPWGGGKRAGAGARNPRSCQIGSEVGVRRARERGTECVDSRTAVFVLTMSGLSGRR